MPSLIGVDFHRHRPLSAQACYGAARTLGDCCPIAATDLVRWGQKRTAHCQYVRLGQPRGDIAVDLLEAIFQKSPAEAFRIMMNVHVNGRGIAGVYPWEMAETKVDQVASLASGVGVGLALVARFAELHGGRAWVQAREGGGASFRVWLPGPAKPA